MNPRSRKSAYRGFLKTDFWKNLAASKKLQVGGMCEVCGSTEDLEAHHIAYPTDWFQSSHEHLEVLCRKHHRQAHGLPHETYSRIFPFREDERFNRFLHWAGYLRGRTITRGIPLKGREEKYLLAALECYPPSESDSAMAFHVHQALRQ
jgi:hypothetical protein